MGIIQLVTDLPGQIGDNPRRPKLITTDNLATITTAGYLNPSNLQGQVVYTTDVFDVYYSWVSNISPGTYVELLVSISNGVITLSNEDASLSGPVVVSTSTSSATPGTVRSLTGKVTETATTMTSGNIAGVRGEADLVSASGGFVYGVQGKVIPTGTLSGSVWAPAIFGQYDLSHATINAGQIAAIWGDMGASGGTFTNVTGARMFAGTNTISTLTLNSMIYLYGKATNLLELSGSSSTYISSGGAGTLSGTINKIAITIDGTTFYIPCATVIS